MKKGFVIVILAIILSCLSSYSAVSLPVVEILGTQYYVYEIKKGDSLFGIARQFGWDDKQLQKLNPAATSPLKKGAKLYYPVKENDIRKDASIGDPESAGLLSPLKHKIKSGETVYSISRTYGIPVENIYQLNPQSRKGIKAGEELILRNAELKSNSDTAGYYSVKKGDTLYQVAKENGVTVAAILKENPGVSEKNFKAGSVIKMPPAGTGITMAMDTVEQVSLTGFEIYKVGKDESWNGIAKKNDVTVDELREANPGVSKPKNNQLISIPKIETQEVEMEVEVSDPRELSAEGVRDIYEDVHKISDSSEKNIVKVAIVLSEPTAKKDLEFTRGFLTSIDNQKRGKAEISLKVIEGTKSSTEILNELDEFHPSILFVTSDNTVPEYLVEYSTVACVPLVNTFDVKSEAFTENPYMVQLLAPSGYFNEEISQYVNNVYGKYKLIFVGEEDASDQIAAALRMNWNSQDILSLPDGDLAHFTLSGNKSYLLYSNTTKKGEIAEFLSAAKELSEQNPGVEIQIMGRPNWIIYDDVYSKQFHEGDVLIPSRFYFDKDSNNGKLFISRYKELFDRSPVKSFPVYAAMGYDAANYFIPQIASTGGDMNKFSSTDDSLQIPFHLIRPSNWTGLINPAVYLVRFTPYDTIEKTVVE